MSYTEREIPRTERPFSSRGHSHLRSYLFGHALDGHLLLPLVSVAAFFIEAVVASRISSLRHHGGVLVLFGIGYEGPIANHRLWQRRPSDLG